MASGLATHRVASRPVPPSTPFEAAVHRHIEAHLCDSALGTAGIAAALGVDARAVLAARGTTPTAHLLDRRLALAAERLSEAGARPVVTILAHELGFSDAAHFCRRFKARLGCSPGQWAQPRRDRSIARPRSVQSLRDVQD